MKIFYDSAPRLLHLLLLAELFVHSSPHPAHSVCGVFRSMAHHIDMLLNSSNKLHDLTDEQLANFEGMNNNLHSLHIKHTADQLSSLTSNESLSMLLVYTQSFRQHMDWLKTAKVNLSLPSQPAEGASTHLLQLSKLVKTSLHQINEEVTESLPASLPVVSSAFEALQFSVEISERLQMFCHWSKRMLHLLRTRSRCPRH